MQNLDQDYWQDRYVDGETGWDIGSPSTPLKTYFDQLTDKDLKILVPGAGNAHEVEYLFKKGFKNVFLLDWAKQALLNFKKRNPEFPDAQLLQEDFFKHQGEYDLIVEQTFFCAINPALRQQYAQKVNSLLNNDGKLVGLFFGREFDEPGPPFGGNIKEYKSYFDDNFDFWVFEECHNSIEPRKGSELFALLKKY